MNNKKDENINFKNMAIDGLGIFLFFIASGIIYIGRCFLHVFSGTGEWLVKFIKDARINCYTRLVDKFGKYLYLGIMAIFLSFLTKAFEK